MSKVHEKETGLLDNLANTGLADELETRLRELERNIAVAREFIKLADESYSELRHKWNLLQQEMRSRPETNFSEQTRAPTKKTTEHARFKDHSRTKERTKSQVGEVRVKDSEEVSMKVDTRPRPAKVVTPNRKELEPSNEEGDSTSPKRPFRGSRSRPKPWRRADDLP